MRVLLSLVLLALLNAGAQPSNAAVSSSKHFLWRITNAAAPFYLLGSMHALRGSDYPIAPEIDRAIAGAQRVIFETDPGVAEGMTLRKKLQEAGSYPFGITIEQKVRPSTMALLRQIAAVRLSEYSDRKPWAIAYFQLYQPETEAFRTRLSIDQYVYDKTRSRVEFSGLETADEFVHMTSSMTDSESESFLLESIGYARRCPELLVDTVEAWKTGNAGRVYQLYAPRRRPSGYWHWIQRRQRNWIPRIEAAIKTGKPTVVVAGALHFCGPNDIVSTLRARGYRIEQL